MTHYSTVTISMSKPEAVELILVMSQASEGLRMRVAQARHDAHKWPQSVYFAEKVTDTQSVADHFEDVFCDVLRKVLNNGITHRDIFPNRSNDDDRQYVSEADA